MDRFSDILVTQTLSVGMERIKSMLFPLLVKVLREDGAQIRGIYERNDVAIRALEGLEQGKGWFPLGEEFPDTVTEICENGIRYRVDVRTDRKPASSWIRSTTVWPWRGWPGVSGCWTALPTPAPSP